MLTLIRMSYGAYELMYMINNLKPAMIVGYGLGKILRAALDNLLC